MNKQHSANNIERWGIFELTLKGPQTGNPFTEVSFSAQFQFKNRSVKADGFYDGNGLYKVRCMPDAEGAWSYVTTSSAPELNGVSGGFTCAAAQKGNHGPVRVNQKYHFIYEDGKPYIPVGTTCYVWNHQGTAREEETLRTLSSAPFNKLRMCVFPKRYLFNENEPEHYPFSGSREKGWDYSRFNPAFFQHLEQLIHRLRELEIEADLILFHPYDSGHWGFDRMDALTDERYLRYLVARLAAFRNIWWSFANEYDLLKEKTLGDWDKYFRIVQESDPYQHLRSIHNCRSFYDHNKPWVTHCSIQNNEVQRVTEWRTLYNKPIVLDEAKYEGNIHRHWGNITAQEMVFRFWEAFTRGGYAGHGETYLHPEDVLWWAKGGKLYGQSPARIAFLRKIMEEGPAPGGLEPGNLGKYLHTVVGKGDEYFIVYNGISQPAYQLLCLPPGGRYKIELIDTWEMSITPVAGTFSGECQVNLPVKPYLALRIKKE